MCSEFASTELGALALFAGLSPDELDRIREMLRPETAAEGELVFSQAEPASDACIVLSGMLKVYLDRPDGSEIVFAMLGSGEVVGELNLIDHLGRSANVAAMEPTRLLWLDERAFRACLASIPRLADNLLTILARRLRLANAQIQALGALAVQGRVAHQLLAFAHGFGEPDGAGGVRIHPRLTNVDLAGMVGATVEQVDRVVKMLERNAYVSVDEQRRYTLYDLDALTRLCE